MNKLVYICCLFLIFNFFYNGFSLLEAILDNSINANNFTTKETNLYFAKWNSIDIKYGIFEGKTIWISNNEPIYGLKIIFNPGKYTSMTDYDGIFRVKLPFGKYKLDIFYLNLLLKTDYIIIDSESHTKLYSFQDLPNQSTIEIKNSL
ncbi:hypothetical protein [Leptospira yanagawae]|nr:hypothetical protein [Leptospira yanagawae]